MAETERFGQRLARLREARRLRYTDLAYAAGVTEGCIRQIETGQTKNATLQVGIRLAKLLGVSAEYLATGTEDGTQETGVQRVVLDRLDDMERRIRLVERRAGVAR